MLKIIEFTTDHAPDGRGGFRDVDYVKFCHVGKNNYAVQKEAVSRLRSLEPLAGNEDNIAVTMAHKRWDQISAAYDAWKNGDVLPLDGTPLAAFSALNQPMAARLKAAGIDTVEALADIGDAVVSRIDVPKLKDLRSQAQLFIKNQDRTAASHELKEQQETIQALKEELAEQKEGQAAEMAAMMDDMKELKQALINQPSPVKPATKKAA